MAKSEYEWPKGAKLTWQVGGGNRRGRWKKVYKGHVLYYPGGEGPDDEDGTAYAVSLFAKDKWEIDNGRTPISKRPGGFDEHFRKEAEQWDRHEQWEQISNRFRADPAEVFSQAAPQPVAVGETIADAVESYMVSRRPDVAAGLFKPTSFSRLEQTLRHFVDFAGSEPVSAITGKLLDDYRGHLLAKVAATTLSQSVARNTLVNTRTFVGWVYETERIDRLPRNLKKVSVPRETFVPRGFTPAEVQRIVELASDRNKLYILLMANTGCYGADIANLRHDEVEWREGRIIRRRTKTERHADAPTTNYVLWDATFELLKQFRSGDPVRVILSETGGPLWHQQLDGGEVTKADLISQALKRHFHRTAVQPIVGGRTARHLRKTGASLLKASDTFGDLAEAFLAHSPTSVADRHYVEPPQRRFDRAVVWLGEQLGYATDRSRAGVAG